MRTSRSRVAGPPHLPTDTSCAHTNSEAAVSTPTSTNPRVQVIPRDDEQRVAIVIDGAAFTSYIYPDTIKKPVLYPLRSARGTVVTRGYPLEPRPRERVDHPHHVGLWFNYGSANGLDFWNNSDAIPAEKRAQYGTIRHRQLVRAASGETGELAVVMEWLGPDGRPLLREDTTFVFSGTETARTIDRLATLTALDVDVDLKDDKEGMLGIRVARELEAPDEKPALRTAADGSAREEKYVDNDGVNGVYRSSAGLEGDAVWGTRGDWVKLSGTVAGETVSITIIDHPQNPGYPTYWHARGYGLFAANTLGQSAFSDGRDVLNLKLSAGQSASFKYRILIDTRDDLPDAELNEEFRDFSAV